MIKHFFKDLLIYIPSQIVLGIVGLLSIPVVTRLFHPEAYGNYSIIMATISVLAVVAGWLPMSIIRFYSAYDKENKINIFKENIVYLSLISTAAISFLFVIITCLIKKQIPLQIYALIYPGIGVFFATAIFDCLQQIIRVERKVNWYSAFSIWKSLGGLIIALLLIFYFKIGIVSLLWGSIIAIAIVFPFLLLKSIKGISFSRFYINSSIAYEMIRYSFPLVLGNLAAWILNLSDRYLLKIFRESQEVGIYSASYNLANRSILLLTSLLTLAASPISMLIWEKEGEEKSKEWMNKIARYFLIACVPFAVGLSILSKDIISFMTSEKYYDGYKIVPFVAFGILFLGIQQHFQLSFLFYKKTRYITISIVIAGLLNVILNFLFIPKYGYIAASITTFISYGVLLIIIIIISRRFFIWKYPFKSLFKICSASIIMGIVVVKLAKSLNIVKFLNLSISIAVGCIVYFTLLFVFKEVLLEEKKVIIQVVYRCLPKKYRNKKLIDDK